MKRRAPAGRLAMATLALAVMTSAGPASAATQMFKCVIDKRTVYQQQACPANAEPAPGVASAPANGATVAPLGPAASSTVRSLKPVSYPASSAPATPR